MERVTTVKNKSSDVITHYVDIVGHRMLMFFEVRFSLHCASSKCIKPVPFYSNSEFELKRTDSFQQPDTYKYQRVNSTSE